MNITNGSVTRSVKVADYETRTVALSFNVDEGMDAATLEMKVADVVALVERRAHNLKVEPKLNPVQDQRADDPSAVATSSTAAPILSTATEPVSASEPPSTVITDDDLLKACQAATTRAKDPAPTKDVIAKFVEKPGMGMRTIPQEQRASFLEALKFVGATGHAADY